MRISFGVGTVLGIPIRIHPSWFLVLGLVVYVLYEQMRFTMPQWEWPPLLGMALATGLLLFVSVLAHELAHSVMATRRGVPVGGITLFMLGGVSHIMREARRPLVECLIAAAGPLLSLALAGALLAAAYVARSTLPDDRLFVAVVTVVELLGWLNLALGVFNFLPGFPLDGGRVLRALLWGLTGSYWLGTLISVRLGQAFGAFVMAGSVYAFVRAGELLLLWPSLIGGFLVFAATASLAAARHRRLFAGAVAGDVLSTASVEASTPLTAALSERMLPLGRTCVLVEEGGAYVGLLHLKGLRAAPHGAWSTTPASSAMTPASALPTVDAAEDAYEAYEALEDDRELPAVLVTREGQVAGAVTHGDLAFHAQVRRAARRTGKRAVEGRL